jgi:hypothetical protein
MPRSCTLEIGWRGATERLTIRPLAARALAEALLAYHDPRDNGACSHCATGRLDSNLKCRTCGFVQGIFGQTLAHLFQQEQSALGRRLPAAVPETAKTADGQSATRARAGLILVLGLIGAAVFLTEGAATDRAGVYAVKCWASIRPPPRWPTPFSSRR